MAAITFAFGRYDAESTTFDGVFAKKMISARAVSHGIGLKEYLEDAVGPAHQDITLMLSELHGRTADLDEYCNHAEHFKAEHFKAYAGPMLKDHNAKEVRQRHARLQRNKQRFWSNVVNLIFAVNGVLSAKSKSLKTPIILFGDGNFANVKGCLPGNYAWLKQFLSKSFAVLIFEEFNTSQRCPKCFDQLEMHEPSKGVRVKRCQQCPGGGPSGRFVVTRDIGTGMNLITIALCMVISGTRPSAFSA